MFKGMLKGLLIIFKSWEKDEFGLLIKKTFATDLRKMADGFLKETPHEIVRYQLIISSLSIRPLTFLIICIQSV